MLTNVTLTGADDTIDPQAIINLSRKLPFAEFGILVGSHDGVARFPSGAWFDRLQILACEARPHEIPLSLHVCGGQLRSVIKDGVFPIGGALIRNFRRMQFNFHGEVVANRDTVIRNIAAASAMTTIPEIIVQLDGVNDWILDGLLLRGIKASGLYDRSHGAGVKPDVWPKPNPAWKVGYAGGLSHGNIVKELKAILALTGKQPFWVDMESSLYAFGKFQAWHCECVLGNCKDFIDLEGKL